MMMSLFTTCGLSLCLTGSRVTQKVVDGFSQNLEKETMDWEKSWSNLGRLRLGLRLGLSYG